MKKTSHVSSKTLGVSAETLGVLRKTWDVLRAGTEPALFGSMFRKVYQKAHLLFYAQSPDFHKPRLCYYLKILYL